MTKKVAVKKVSTKKPATIGKGTKAVKPHHAGHTTKARVKTIKTDYGVK
jgi:hypothetical protein